MDPICQIAQTLGEVSIDKWGGFVCFRSFRITNHSKVNKSDRKVCVGVWHIQILLTALLLVGLTSQRCGVLRPTSEYGLDPVW